MAENGKARNIFSVDGTGIRNYQQYGDCVSFDTAYKTNNYVLRFAPFVGINGHGYNCLFTCGLTQNENIGSFKLLFENFLLCMSGKQPKSQIIDQDKAMK